MMRLGFNSWALLLLGGLLLAQSLYLAVVKVTHLGVIIPAGLGVVLVLLALAGDPWSLWLDRQPLRRSVWNLARAGFVAWLLSLAAFFVWLTLRQQTQDLQGFTPQVIVVLGSSTPNAKPSPTLVERLNLADTLARYYPAARVVVSGGVDFRQVASEASVMAGYLQSRGLDQGRIMLEDLSTSTHENLIFSLQLVQKSGLGPEAPMLLVTNDFHTLRAGWIARKAGWKAVRTAGAPTPLYMRYNAWLREYFACLSGLLFREY
ncbi:MAG: hypothetical protein JWR60_3410 [Polaromonas sp.]|nr:hypothetical protein [Polaromonas sp.]